MNLEEKIAQVLYGELRGYTDEQAREDFHFADGGPAMARHRKFDRDFLRAEIEHIRSVGAKVAALVRPPDSPSGWQPIETAPKDGRAVLLYGEGGVIVSGQWITPNGFNPLVSMLSEENGGYWCHHGLAFPIKNPTHWMPLPEPPSP